MKTGNSLLTLKPSAICFLLYFLLKPFYLFGSGSIQPGDLFLLLSFFFIIVENRNGIKIQDKGFVLFVVFVVLINTFYFTLHQALDFLKSSLYYIFNLLAIICFRNLMYDKKWLSKLVLVCKINLIIQLIIYLAKMGDYWRGTYRYMGTYNDPNQLGYAIISTFAIIFLLNDSKKYIYFIIAVFLVFKTASAGMLIALIVMFSFDLINILKTVIHEKLSVTKIPLFFCAIVLIGIVLTQNNHIIDLRGFRLEQKISKGSSVIQSFINDRGLNVAFDHPIYFIFGYGEGFKFERYGHSGEMHSTWISLFYYYGLIPFIILLKWIYSNIKGISRKYIPVYIAIFVEAFTLINHRQPSFWMIIMIGTLLRGDRKSEAAKPVGEYNCASI